MAGKSIKQDQTSGSKGNMLDIAEKPEEKTDRL